MSGILHVDFTCLRKQLHRPYSSLKVVATAGKGGGVEAPTKRPGMYLDLFYPVSDVCICMSFDARDI